MNMIENQELREQLAALLAQLMLPQPETKAEKPKPTEMLTIKECKELANGISEHTIRKLIAQKKIPSIRAGEGVRGKILIPKSALINYLNGVT